MVQLWVDLPAADKMTEPRYQTLTKKNIPEVPFAHGIVRVIAGNYADTPGAAQTFSPIELYDIRFEHAGELDVTFADGDNTMVLVVSGSAEIQGKSFEAGSLAYLSVQGQGVHIRAAGANTKVLVMSGKPLGQPVFSYGPFVMTSPEELMQAFRDLNDGKMGRVPEADMEY